LGSNLLPTSTSGSSTLEQLPPFPAALYDHTSCPVEMATRFASSLALGIACAGFASGGASISASSNAAVAEGNASASATPFSQQDAVKFAYLSTAAYCGSLESGWACGIACEAVPGVTDIFSVSDESVDAHAFVGRLDGKCILAFRGTDSLVGFKMDQKSSNLVALPGCSFKGIDCKVGQSFLEQYQSIAPRVKENLAAIGCDASTPLAVTGHSLGAALAMLALRDLVSEGYNVEVVYTFGQPRVGDPVFAHAFRQTTRSVPLFRVTRGDDPFVHMPSQTQGFQHVGLEVFYPGNVAEGYSLCNGSHEDPSCSDSISSSSIWMFMLQCAVPEKCGHYLYMHDTKKGLLSHASCNSDASFVLLP